MPGQLCARPRCPPGGSAPSCRASAPSAHARAARVLGLRRACAAAACLHRRSRGSRPQDIAAVCPGEERPRRHRPELRSSAARPLRRSSAPGHLRSFTRAGPPPGAAPARNHAGPPRRGFSHARAPARRCRSRGLGSPTGEEALGAADPAALEPPAAVARGAARLRAGARAVRARPDAARPGVAAPPPGGPHPRGPPACRPSTSAPSPGAAPREGGREEIPPDRGTARGRRRKPDRGRTERGEGEIEFPKDLCVNLENCRDLLVM
jgi:hypothetical protein